MFKYHRLCQYIFLNYLVLLLLVYKLFKANIHVMLSYRSNMHACMHKGMFYVLTTMKWSLDDSYTNGIVKLLKLYLASCYFNINLYILTETS